MGIAIAAAQGADNAAGSGGKGFPREWVRERILAPAGLPNPRTSPEQTLPQPTSRVTLPAMPKRAAQSTSAAPPARPSSLIDTRVIYCGDCLEQLRKLPDACIDLIYIDPP